MTNRREINTTIHFQHSHENNIHSSNSRPRPTHSHTLPSSHAAPAAHPFSAGPAAPARRPQTAPDAPAAHLLLTQTHARPPEARDRRRCNIGCAYSRGCGSPWAGKSRLHSGLGGSYLYIRAVPAGIVRVLFLCSTFSPLSLSLSPLYIDSKSYTQKCTPNTG